MGAGHYCERRDRIALMRHGARAAALTAAPFNELADFALHHQDQIICELAGTGSKHGKCSGQRAWHAAIGVPGQYRLQV